MGSTLADHHHALREQIVEQREALAELDELLQSSADDTGEIQQVGIVSTRCQCPLCTEDLTCMHALKVLSEHVQTFYVYSDVNTLQGAFPGSKIG